MQQFFRTLVTGLAQGSIYGSLALALVLIYKATEVINFAQGEMAMFTTYIAWALITHHGVGYWWAFTLTLVIAFLGGVALQRTVVRPLERASVLTVVMGTIALLGQYVHFVTTELQLPVALVVLLVVLLVRPAGLLGRVVVRRV